MAARRGRLVVVITAMMGAVDRLSASGGRRQLRCAIVGQFTCGVPASNVPAKRKQAPRVPGRYSVEVDFRFGPIRPSPASRSNSDIQNGRWSSPTRPAAHATRRRRRKALHQGADYFDCGLRQLERATVSSYFFVWRIQTRCFVEFAVFLQLRHEAPGRGKVAHLDISITPLRRRDCVSDFRKMRRRGATITAREPRRSLWLRSWCGVPKANGPDSNFNSKFGVGFRLRRDDAKPAGKPAHRDCRRSRLTPG